MTVTEHPELLALEVRLKSDNFLTVRETLSRIGIGSEKTQTLWQTCHILQKGGRYFIVHFKEMFLLDGKNTEFTQDDIARRNAIAHLLTNWGLVELVNPESAANASIAGVRVIKHDEKDQWKLVPKYTIGKHKRAA